MSLFEKVIPHLLPRNRVIQTEHVPMEEIDEIVCFSNTAIGDTLFSTPVFRSLKHHFPDKKLTAVLNPTNAELFATNPHIDEILLYNGKTGGFLPTLLRLKKHSPKLILILHSNEPQATPLAVLSGAQYIFKTPNSHSRYRFWHSNPPISSSHRYVVYDRLDLLKFLSIVENNCRLELFLKPEWIDSVQHHFAPIRQKSKKVIGFQVGASSISRMWFLERWIELGKKLLNYNPDFSIVLTGAPNEKDLTNRVAEKINSKNLYNFAGTFSLPESAALLKELDLLITPDTGPLHIAAALKTPTLALYAVMDNTITNPPFDENIHQYIQKPRTCSPCITRQCRYQECMLQISSDEVFQKSINMLLKDK